MPHDDAAGSLALQILVFLGAVSLLVPAFRRLRLSAVMAFLAIGVALGPFGLGALARYAPELGALRFAEGAGARLFAELGVVFLLFAIGLEVSSERLWALRRLVLGLGVLQLSVTAALIALVALAFGNSPQVAAIIGLAFALSSTAMGLQLMGERRQLSGPVGRAGFSVLLLQDVAVVPILFAVGALSASGAPGASLIAALSSAAFAIAVIVIVGRLLLRPMFRWVAAVDSREVFVAMVLLVAIGAAVAAERAGLSMALGAFLAGLLLAETEFRHEIETDLEPFKGLLLGLFFVTVGLKIDLDLLAGEPFRVLGAVIGLFALKGLVLAPLARAFGMSWPQALELALLLGQAGEFGFVVLAAATAGGAFPQAAADFMLLVVALSLFVTPLVADAGARLARGLADPGRDLAPAENAENEGHVVIAGYGRVGQALGALLQEQGLAHLALDDDAELVAALRERSWPVHFGDASRRDVLQAVGAGQAQAIVVTMDNSEAVERIVMAARAAWPSVPVFARARDADQARRLHQLGASFASPEALEATLQLGEALLNGLGFPDEAARRIIGEQRERERIRTLFGPRAEVER